MKDKAAPPGVHIKQIFLLSTAFAHRQDVLKLPAETKPEVGDVGVKFTTGLTQDGSGGLLTVQVQTKEANDPIYHVDLTMAAILEGMPDGNMSVDEYIRIAGSALVYPFVREAFANLTGRGRFGPVWLQPFNVQAAWKSAEGAAVDLRPDMPAIATLGAATQKKKARRRK